MNRGYTLLEVVMATALLATIFTLTMESLVSLQRWGNAEAAVATLRDQGNTAMRRIFRELNATAWYLPETASMIDGATTDRSVRYYPYVLTQTDGGKSSAFTIWQRTSQVPYLGNEKMSDVHMHELPSHELVYIKVACTSDVDDPKQAASYRVNFNDANLASFQEEVANLPVITTMGLELEDLGTAKKVTDAAMRYERDTAGRLREYGLVVVSSRVGSGELQVQYAHRGGSTTPIVHEVITQDVDRMIVETYRTSPDLSPDQIRVTLFMSRVDASGIRQYHTVSRTIAMRSTVDPAYDSAIDAYLGIAGGHPVSF